MRMSVINDTMYDGKTLTYSEQEGKREESFNKAIKAISLVVRSDV